MLMHHYAVNVASLLQPISHPRNPYRELYLPAALQVATELTSDAGLVKGTVQSSLFHSLLASSAFHLSSCTTDKGLYYKIGTQHKQRALSLLQASLQLPRPTLDHQALLMSMLSLVTIDVSGRGTTYESQPKLFLGDVGRRCRIFHPSSGHETTTAISQTLESGQ